MRVTISELRTYPVKGCRGTAVDSLDVSPLGAIGDRSFAIWADGGFVDQKDTPTLARIGARLDLDTDVLTLTHPERAPYSHVTREDGPLLDAGWLLEEFAVVDQGPGPAEWLSDILARDVRLVTPGPAWQINFPIPQLSGLHGLAKRSFTAASPISVANESSLVDLNGRLDTPVPMDRFRMNMVVSGMEAFAEDHLRSLGNDEIELISVTQAERCIMITTDQTTGERPDNNVMKTLSTYRKKPKSERFASGLMFGSYMTVEGQGTVNVGDTLTANLEGPA